MRRFAGLFLVLLAVLLLAGWEAKGRELILMEEVWVAKDAIATGQALSPELFRRVSVPGDALVEDAFPPAKGEALKGKTCLSAIPSGGQLSMRQVGDSADLEKAGRSYFVIRREWIFMRSSALRKGDFVDIVSQDGKTAFGRFAVAFVKNAEEKEVTEKEGAAAFLQGGGSDRSAGSDPIDHVEIVTDLEGYMAIKAFAEQQPGPALILVKREGMS